MPFPSLGETEELNESTRKEAEGSFISLFEGVTHYELRGDPEAETVVLVHGFSVPYFIYDPTFEFLTRSGFRVLRYDLFGRGLSDRPRTKYDLPLYIRQLSDLLTALKIARPVTLVGLSMGGPIVIAFQDRYPEQVCSLILIDPCGASPIGLSWVLNFTKLPLIGDLVIGLFGSESMVKGIASDFFGQQLVEHFQAKYRIQMRYKGFKRAILSSLRHGMLGSFYEHYQRVGKLKKPTLILWGRDDSTVPLEHSRQILAAIPHAELHVIDHCGHIPHYEKPEIVNPLLLDFLSGSSEVGAGAIIKGFPPIDTLEHTV
jgi:pimeloyl-ACP methyl ester carboxylesterase